MSGGGGGVIIIKSKIKEIGELESVKDCLGPVRRAALEDVLEKDVHNWSPADFHLVIRAITKAYDDHC